METQTKIVKSSTLLKISIVVMFSILSISVCEARVSIGINLGGPVYAPAPVYYGPQPGYYAPAPEYYAPEDGPDDYDTSDVEWVPRHFEDGYWVPGRYVEYMTTAPGPDFYWVQGRWDHGHHWHRGAWRHYR
jgi:hypothetical protein